MSKQLVIFHLLDKITVFLIMSLFFVKKKKNNSLGNRAVHIAGRVRWPNSLPASQPIAKKHLPMCYG
jgi:hypothetical protein